MKKIFLTSIILLLMNNVNANHSDTSLIRKHLVNIIETEYPRHYLNTDILDEVAAYIFGVFQQYADSVYYQPYVADDLNYKNVIGIFGSENSETIVVGAHYDVCGQQDGADDNASGVVGLLELARLLKGQTLNYRIELVAYSLEEPPYFRTEYMGSYIHATSLVKNKVNVYGMICLEMIGYFDDRPNTQDYPLKFLSLFYGNKGDYITLVNKFGKGKFASRFTSKFKRLKKIKTKKFTGPTKLEGIDFSDHQNYWKYGISAVMVTDTAFYRNKNYHQETDTIDTLDLERMGKVIDSVYETLLHLK